MSDVLEIVFEDVDQQDAIGLLLHLLSCAKKEIEANFLRGDFELMEGLISRDDLASEIGAEEDVSIIFRAYDLHLGGVKLPMALVRLVKYGARYDVDFSFGADDAIDVRDLMKGLHVWAKEIAAKFMVKSFFGGLEPANDGDTQYFCGANEGPLMA